MRIHSAAQNLSLVLLSLQEDIEPYVTERSALEKLSIVKNTLRDLLKRHGAAVQLLRDCITRGLALEKDILQAVGAPATLACNGVEKSELAKGVKELNGHPIGATQNKAEFEKLADEHGELTLRLLDLCNHLSRTKPGGTEQLLRRAAQWEASYYAGMGKLELGDHDQFITAGPYNTKDKTSSPRLTQEYLEEFLKSQRGPSTKVNSLKPIDGGHAKQTYVCEIELESGETQDLIVRKNDPSPVLQHGMFNVEQEFLFLRSLSKTDYPCPKPYELCRRTDGVDGSFYTMSRMPGDNVTMFLESGNKKFSEDILLHIAELLAKLHSYPLDTFADYFEAIGDATTTNDTLTQRYRRILHGWKEYSARVEHLPSPYIPWLFDWLERNIPADSRCPVLLHGDYSPHNMLKLGDRISAVLDWECVDFGAPEQDLAFVEPVIKQHMDWQKFLDHYRASGGPEISNENITFYQVYAHLRPILAFNKATWNLQFGASRDIRFAILELGYQAVFMNTALSLAGLPPPSSVETLVLENGTAIPIHGDDTNTRQKPGAQKNWQESVMLGWWDDENSIGGYHRLGHEPNNPEGPRVTLWTNITTPSGIFKHSHYIPLQEDDLLPNGGFGSGDKSCTVEFKNGEHIWTINHTADDGTVLEAKLVFVDTSVNVDLWPKKNESLQKFTSHHVDIPGRVTGWLRVDGREYKISSGLGIRDHAWGARDWGAAMLSHRWVAGTSGPEFSFIIVTYHSSDDRLASFGWVIRDGARISMAKSVDVLAYMEMDAAVNRGGHVTLELEDGEVVEIECKPATKKAFANFHRGILNIDRICRFTAKLQDDTAFEGFADFETSNNALHGERKPGSLRNGVVADGWTKF